MAKKYYHSSLHKMCLEDAIVVIVVISRIIDVVIAFANKILTKLPE